MADNSSKYGTQFTESEALLAVQEKDNEYARELISGMLPGERFNLAAAAYDLAILCERVEANRK